MLILPETDSEAAQGVAARISERLKNDDEEPAISVSAGTAIYPQDGRTIDELFGSADRTLYAAKDASKRKLRLQT